MYKNILVGTKTYFPDWIKVLKRNVLNNVSENLNIIDLSNIKVEKVIIQKNISFIIPMSEEDYINALKIDTTKFGIKVLYPNDNIYKLLLNKNLFTDFMYDNFVDYIPTIYYINDKLINKIKYPCIYKPNISTNGKNVKIIFCETELEKHIDQFNQNYVIQEYINDNYEYGGFFLCIDGIIKNYKIIRSMYKNFYVKTTNFPKNYETVCDCDISVFEKIFKKLQYSGGACVDFKVVSKTIYIFEINPRFGGSAFSCNFIMELLNIK